MGGDKWNKLLQFTIPQVLSAIVFGIFVSGRARSWASEKRPQSTGSRERRLGNKISDNINNSY